MSVSKHLDQGEAELAQTHLKSDQKVEDRLLWKGLAALLFTVAVAVARQRWWM
jgi:hypothetical protein